MDDCEHKKAGIVTEDGFVRIKCDQCHEIIRQHKGEHVAFARKFYANSPNDAWILQHCPMELKFMEEFESYAGICQG